MDDAHFVDRDRERGVFAVRFGDPFHELAGAELLARRRNEKHVVGESRHQLLVDRRLVVDRTTAEPRYKKGV